MQFLSGNLNIVRLGNVNPKTEKSSLMGTKKNTVESEENATKD